MESRKADFTIIVGFTDKPLGLISRNEAIERARGEFFRGGTGAKVTLLERTADRGAVRTPIMEI